MVNQFIVDENGEVQVVRQRIRKWSNYSRVLDSRPEKIAWNNNIDDKTELHALVYFVNKGRPLPEDNCVPDMVMSMQDIYERYRTNREVPTVLASYDSDELDAQLPDFSRMSKVELADLMKQNNRRIESWRAAKEANDEALAKKALADRDAEFERLRKFEANELEKQKVASFAK